MVSFAVLLWSIHLKVEETITRYKTIILEIWTRYYQYFIFFILTDV